MLDVSSPTVPIDIGIAQGSLMFFVYMNDINRRSIETNFLIYAEDTIVFIF